MFDELFDPQSDDAPAPAVMAPIPAVVAQDNGAQSDASTLTNEPDAPSPSNSQTTPESSPPLVPNDVE